MSNLKDFLGGSSTNTNASKLRGDTPCSLNSLTVGTTKYDFYNRYDILSKFETLGDVVNLEKSISDSYNPNNTTNAIEYSYDSSADLIVESSTTVKSLHDYIGVISNNLVINGVLEAQPCGLGSSGKANHSGRNIFGSFDFKLKGGSGGASGDSSRQQNAGYGYSTGGRNGSGNDGTAGGNGGGSVFILSDSIIGHGTISAKGTSAPRNTRQGYGGGGGGGGTICIITRSWSGTVKLDVNGGAGGVSGSSSGKNGQVGSYAIIKLENDNSLTVMVCSIHGSVSNLNGQTPVHGTDASIAW